MATFYAPNGAGAVFPGAIVGDTPNPYSAAYMNPGVYLTTGDLNLGDPGEASTLGEFTIELWYQFASVPAGNQTVAFGPLTTTAGIRQWAFTLTTTGAITFAARNNTPSTISATSSALAAGVWYHLVGQVQGGNVRLWVNGSQAASTAWSGNVQALGSTAGQLDMGISDAGTTVIAYFDEVAFYRIGLTSDRIAAHYQAGVQRGFLYGQEPGERVIAVLDSVNSTAPRNINLGTRNMTGSYMTGQSPLGELESAREAENVDAALFVSKDGTITFLDAAHRSSSPYNTVQMTLGDAGGSELAYDEVSVDYSDDTLANKWDVTRTNGLTQTVSDATSISQHDTHPQSISDVPVTADSMTLAIATGMLAKYKDPLLRGTSVVFDSVDGNATEQVFRRDIGDKVRMLRTPPGGGSRIDQNLFIDEVTVSGSNDGGPWSMVLGLSPL
jgi:hypothetical protein